MSKKLPLLLILILVIIICIAAALIFTFSQKNKLLKPNFSSPPDQSLSTLLQNASLNLQNSPKVFDDRIEASVSGVTVYFSKTSNLSSQVRALQLILPTVKMDSKSPKVIDVRLVNKVVIKY